MKEMMKFDMPKNNQSSIIKVIGVGGGGSNAVNHMFRQGIKGVDFMICNTDAQAMESSPVPLKIQLGEKGLGAGSIPSVGKEAAIQKTDEIKELLGGNTQMVFITAGMGGGTGTGAAPVIASIAKELDILTVGIVTLPFSFEGKKRRSQADEGIKELKESVDTLLIICNDKIRELYGDLKLSDAFHKADDVLTTAAKGIAEIITVTGYINVDFEDVKTVMRNSGKAIMGYAIAEGENRAIDAVKTALASPLLNDNDIEGASDVLLYITSGKEEISMDEVTEITDYIQTEAKAQAEIIWGNGYDESLGNNISITLIATGFDSAKKAQEEIRIRYNLNENVAAAAPQAPAPGEGVDIDRIQLIQKHSFEPALEEESVPVAASHDPERNGMMRDPMSETSVPEPEPAPETWQEDERTVVFDISQTAVEEEVVPMAETEADALAFKAEATPVNDEPIHEFRLNPEKPGNNGENFFGEKLRTTEEPKPFELYIRRTQPETVSRQSAPTTGDPGNDLRSQERIERLRSLSMKLNNESTIEALENEPAYMRRNVDLKNTTPSSESRISKYSLYDDGEGKTPEIRNGNSFLHDNVD
jgi:cell division protein FtsZ